MSNDKMREAIENVLKDVHIEGGTKREWCSVVDSLCSALQSQQPESEPVPYLLAKHGMWYAHNDCGYVSRAEMAELYTKEYAESYADRHDEVKAVPLNDIISSPEKLQPYIDRLNRMHRALSGLQSPERTEEI